MGHRHHVVDTMLKPTQNPLCPEYQVSSAFVQVSAPKGLLRHTTNGRTYIIMHIPKTAGASLTQNLLFDGLPEGDGLNVGERCQSELVSCMAKEDRLLTMVREPRHHIQSLYLECVDSAW